MPLLWIPLLIVLSTCRSHRPARFLCSSGDQERLERFYSITCIDCDAHTEFCLVYMKQLERPVVYVEHNLRAIRARLGPRVQPRVVHVTMLAYVAALFAK